MAYSLHNIGHNKCKELLPQQLQLNLDKNPTWPRITNVVSTMEQGLLAVFEECYVSLSPYVDMNSFPSLSYNMLINP
jgi:hypothetical protein